MKPDLYICHTPYQVLVEICRAFSAPCKPDLLLIHSIPEVKVLAKRLEATGLFGKILFFSEQDCGSSLQEKFWRIPLQRIIGVRNVEKYYGFRLSKNSYRNIYIHNDWSIIGRYLQDKGLKYILCEDTFASSTMNSDNLIGVQRSQSFFKLRQKLHYSYQYWGDWTGVQAIESECPEKVSFASDKIVKHSVHEDFKALTSQQKDIILSVFLTDPLPEKAENAMLFLPRDFVVEHVLSQAEQEAIYTAAVREYCAGGQLFIKAHPRDPNDYSKLFPDAVVLQRTMPSEVLNFCLPFRFTRAVTVESHVLGGMEVADEKIMISLQEARALV